MDIQDPCEECRYHNRTIFGYIKKLVFDGDMSMMAPIETSYELMLEDSEKQDPELAGVMKDLCRECGKSSIYDTEDIRNTYESFLQMKSLMAGLSKKESRQKLMAATKQVIAKRVMEDLGNEFGNVISSLYLSLFGIPRENESR